MIQSLGIRSGDRVADLGSGSGYFTFRLADVVGKNGKIYATDIDHDMNSYVAEQKQRRGYENIEIIQAQLQDPLLPYKGVDMVFTCNVYHHLENRAHYFINIKKYLRQGGRVAIIDFKGGAFHHFTIKNAIKSDMVKAGYHLLNEYEFFPKKYIQRYTLLSDLDFSKRNLTINIAKVYILRVILKYKYLL